MSCLAWGAATDALFSAIREAGQAGIAERIGRHAVGQE